MSAHEGTFAGLTEDDYSRLCKSAHELIAYHATKAVGASWETHARSQTVIANLLDALSASRLALSRVPPAPRVVRNGTLITVGQMTLDCSTLHASPHMRAAQLLDFLNDAIEGVK
jgi:hypothetical protein